MANRILIYGATGYVGRMLAQRAKELKLPVVLGGRDARKLAELSDELDLPYSAFALESPEARQRRLMRSDRTKQAGSAAKDQAPNQAVDRALSGIGVVLNAAGPFGATAAPLVRSCLRVGCHYLDVGGEYRVFSELKDLEEEAVKHKIVLAPGAGLTVLGSDLLLRRAFLKAREAGMAQPHSVRVALSRVPTISRGSAKTMLDSVRDGVYIRRAGKPVVEPLGSLVRSFNFGSSEDFRDDDRRICTAMTLADALTIGRTYEAAYGLQQPGNVDNIETYVEASAIEQLTYALAGEFSLALRSWPFKQSLDYALGFWPEGPPASERDAAQQQIVVEVEDRYRRLVQARLLTPNSYDFTVTAALTSARLLLRWRGKHGFLSPSQVVGLSEEAQALKDCRLELRSFGTRPRVSDHQDWTAP